MTKKKRNHPDVEEVLARPWCYYCERDFDDLKILINHQKAKHFKCDKCGRRLNTAGGLSVHMSQVHKETLTTVENALPNRAGLDIEIFGMEGIPEDIAQQHNQRVLTNYHQAEAERRAASGNAVPGSQGNNPTKKPKFESPAELKKRLAEHKAAKLAAEQSGEGSGASTPTAAPVSTQPTTVQPTNGSWQQQAASPTYPTYQQPGYSAPPVTTSYGQPPAPAAYQPPPFGHPQVPYGQAPTPPQPTYGQHPHAYQQAYIQPPQPNYQHPPFPPQNTFSPPPYQSHSSFPGPQYHPQVPQNGMSSYTGHQVGAPRVFGAGSPQPPFQPHQQPHGMRTHSPAHNGLPQRTGSGSLPSAPGLPQRPAVGAPPVNALQFQQMHQGQIPASHNHALPPQPHFSPQQNGYAPPTAHVTVPSPVVSQEVPGASSLDDLISSASKQADANTVTSAEPTPKPEVPAANVSTPVKEEASEEKAGKKEKEKTKPTRLVYSDNEISPEEKMAAMSKYAFTPSQKSIQV